MRASSVEKQTKKLRNSVFMLLFFVTIPHSIEVPMFSLSALVEIGFWMTLLFLTVYQDQEYFITGSRNSPRKVLFKGDERLLKYMAWFSILVSASVLFAHIEMYCLDVSTEIQIRVAIEFTLPWFIPQLLIVGASWANYHYNLWKY